MADNTAQNATNIIATDDIGGVHYPRTKVGFGADGSYTDVAAAAGAFLPVRRVIDSGRTAFTATWSSTNAPTADTVVAALVTQKGATTLTAQTSVPVTSGKVLRITNILLSLRTTTAALPWGVLVLRINHNGAAVGSSPAFIQVPVSGTAAVIGNTGTTPVPIEDGLELSGTMQFALTFANNVATNVTTATVLGYEYTP
jgi:hypothetical protein